MKGRILFILCIFFISSSLLGDDNIFYLGEDTNFITIVSGKPENPDKAPASNSVESIDFTSSDFISKIDGINGFYTEKNGQQNKLYFNGLKDSVLFLYDGVPITSDLTRSVVPLNGEIPLNNLSKIEMVYGASSVLWGPDAYAGVMNAVVKTGKEINGLHIDSFANSYNKEKGFFIEGGNQIGKFDGMFSLYYKEDDKKFKTDYADDSQYIDFYSKITLNNELQLAVKLSKVDNNFKNNYKDFIWDSENSKPFNLIKLEYNKSFDHSMFSVKSYYLDQDYESIDKDFKIKQKNRIYFGGLNYNKDFWDNSAMLSVGYSFRKNHIVDSDIFVRSYLPDYINNKSPFNPLVEKADIDTELHSLYFQLLKHIKDFEVWGGYRKDIHSDYDSSDSYSLGAGYFKDKFYIKVNYGISYRTPFPKKFIGESDVHPEKIYSINVESDLKFNDKSSLNILLYSNRLKDLVIENNYAGYSEEYSSTLYGINLKFDMKISDKLKWSSNFSTIFDSKLDKEEYEVLDYIIVKPNFEIEKYYTLLNKSFDIGAKHFGRTGLYYEDKLIKGFFRINYIGERDFSFLIDNKNIDINSEFTLDIGTEVKFSKKLSGNISAENILNNRFELPGIYAPVKNYPFNVMFTLKYKF